MKILAAVAVWLLIGGAALAQESEWREVQEVFRAPGTRVDSNTVKIALPRIDQTVTKGEVKLTPEFGLTSELRFTGRPEKAMVMAELVLMEREVQPVVTALLGQGLEITALHNHLLGTDPPLMYLHVRGSGPAKMLALALSAALTETGVHPGPAQRDESEPSAGPAQWTALQTILGHKGEQKGSVLSVEIPRQERVTEQGAPLPPSFGPVHHFLFQKMGEKVAATGELALLAHEVNRVAKMLKSNRFELTALNNHHLSEQPRFFYLHFWASDTPEALAKILREAIGMTAAKGTPRVAPTAPPAGRVAPGGAPPPAPPPGRLP